MWLPFLPHSSKYRSGSVPGSVSVSSDLRSCLWLPVLFSQWKIKGLVPANAHFPPGQRSARVTPLPPAVHRCAGAFPPQGVAQHWGQAQSTPEALKGTFLKFSSPTVLRWVPVSGSVRGTLFHFPGVPFLQACSNSRNWVFLMISKPGLMTAKGSTAVALQARGVLSKGCQGAIKAHMAKTQVTSAVNKCASALSTASPRRALRASTSAGRGWGEKTVP